MATTLEAIHAADVLREALARYGTSEIVNTDQGGQFTADECSVKYECVYPKAYYDSVG